MELSGTVALASIPSTPPAHKKVEDLGGDAEGETSRGKGLNDGPRQGRAEQRQLWPEGRGNTACRAPGTRARGATRGFKPEAAWLHMETGLEGTRGCGDPSLGTWPTLVPHGVQNLESWLRSCKGTIRLLQENWRKRRASRDEKLHWGLPGPVCGDGQGAA